MSQADAKQTFGECREGHIPRPLGRFKFDAPLLAAGLLTMGSGAYGYKESKLWKIGCLCGNM